MKNQKQPLKRPDPPVPPPSVDVHTENTGPSPITITENLNAI